MRKQILFALLMLSVSVVWAQSRITGKVTDGSASLAGVTVLVKGTTNGTLTDAGGNYSITAKPTDVLVFSYIGYTAKQVAVGNQTTINVTLDSGDNALQEVVAVGTRTAPRSSTSTPLPVDNLDASTLKQSGFPSFDKVLQLRVPSFTSTNVPVQDANSLLDPYEVRNLGPSRTLLLINGKRKNSSSLTYIQNTVGKGEIGADISAFPMSAVKKVEILRDGASAQYGSDAIAGVINIILKDKVEFTEANIRTGVTHKGDGFLYGGDVNTGFSFGEHGGFATFTIGASRITETNRSGNISVESELSNDLGFGVIGTSGEAAARDFLKRYPDGRNIFGSPQTALFNFVGNTKIPFNENTYLYGNVAYAYKNVMSHANYRVPYWRQDPHYLLHRPGEEYLGYHPTFEGDLDDYNATVGVKTKTAGDWNIDISATVGGNKQLYTVAGTLNRSLGANSPTLFKPGGYGFSHTVGNIDITKALSDKISVAFGSEFRREVYEIFAGDDASYSGEGANSFPGINKKNAGTFSRYNLGAYADMSWDVTPELLINATVRGEHYSDFGDAFVWKGSGRYKITDALTLRASASTGFKAPSLHQQYLQVDQATFVGGGIVIEGIANNSSKAASTLGVPKLKAERANNITVGMGYNEGNFSATLDYYNVFIQDRIVLSSRLKKTGVATNPLDVLLTSAGTSGVSFFINGINTKTEGFDLVLNYKNLELDEDARMAINFAGNYNFSERVGQITTPKVLADAGANIFNRTEESILTTSRPKLKATLGLDFTIANSLTVGLNNTYYGSARFVNADLPDAGQAANVANADNMAYVKFNPKVLTDLNIGYKFDDSFSATLSVTNLFNILPSYTINNLEFGGTATGNTSKTGLTESEVRDLLGFNGRYNLTTYDGSHFSINGTTFLLTTTFKF